MRIEDLTMSEFIELMRERYDSMDEMIEDNPFIKEKYDEDEVSEDEIEDLQWEDKVEAQDGDDE